MKFVLLIHEDVYEELNQVFSYYEECRPDLGSEFLDDWEKSISHLEKHPLIYQIRSDQFRTIKLNRFPFLIIFEVEEEKVFIYKIIHGKRNPVKRFKR